MREFLLGGVIATTALTAWASLTTNEELAEIRLTLTVWIAAVIALLSIYWRAIDWMWI